MPPKIIIYTDGAAKGNPGPGGYGVYLKAGKHEKRISEGFRLTTNNRMELMAVIVGLEALKTEGSDVLIYTDSKYVADAVTQGWVLDWERKAFKKKKNPDLWKRFLKIYRKHSVRFKWVKGHAGIAGNEICDTLAVEASKAPNLKTDKAYEDLENSDPGLF